MHSVEAEPLLRSCRRSCLSADVCVCVCVCVCLLACVVNFPHLCIGEFSLCRVNNGGCQDLCLLTSDGRVNCSCRGDRKLLEDNTCIGNTGQETKKRRVWPKNFTEIKKQRIG